MPAEMLNLKTLLPYFILIGALTALIAHNKRGRRPLPWFFLGFFFGCLALIALFLLPKRSPMTLEPSLTIKHSIPQATYTPSLPAFSSLTPMTTELWYFLAANKEQTGPVSFQGLKQAYEQGKLLKSSYVWNSQLEHWKRLEELPDYLSLVEERPT